jgi:hypothetical protein
VAVGWVGSPNRFKTGHRGDHRLWRGVPPEVQESVLEHSSKETSAEHEAPQSLDVSDIRERRKNIHQRGSLWAALQKGALLVGTERAVDYFRNSSKPMGLYSDQCWRDSTQSGSNALPDSSTATA